MSGRTATATVGPTDTGRASLRTAGNDPAVRRIRIFYAQNRYHEMSRCEIIVRMARRAGIGGWARFWRAGIASALNPSLDINQYAHTAWTVRDGFFKGVITSIAQTPDGYLWLGTEFGLLRFDGVRSVPWQPPAGEHLPGSNIRSLLAARDGRLWIGTDQGPGKLEGRQADSLPGACRTGCSCAP